MIVERWGVKLWLDDDGDLLPILCGGKGGGAQNTVVTPPPMTSSQIQIQNLELSQAKQAGAASVYNTAQQDPTNALAYLKSGQNDPNSRFYGLQGDQSTIDQ